MSYSDIIKCLEDATGPDRVIDAHILISVNGVTMHEDSDPSEGMFAFWQNGTCHNCTRWDAVTGSIDEALKLVNDMLPGEWIDIGGTIDENEWECNIHTEWCEVQEHSRTAPIAIMLALFRALEAKAGAA